MTTKFSTGQSIEKDSFKAGQIAARAACNKSKGINPNFVLVFCSSFYDFRKVEEGIKSVVPGSYSVMGCSSSGEFTEEKTLRGGLVLAMIESDSHSFFTGIGDDVGQEPFEAVHRAVKEFPKVTKGYPHHSAILLVDGLAGRGEDVVLSSAVILGEHFQFCGGAAADDFKFVNTKVFLDDQVKSNAIAVCMIASTSPLFMGIKHGHYPISGPLIVTKAIDNVVLEINKQPAVEVWKKAIQDFLASRGFDPKEVDDPEKMTDLLLKYEIGLSTGSDYKLRFCTSANPDGSMTFACSILEGTLLKVMDSTDEDQIESTRYAAELALEQSKGVKIAGAFVFDCSCHSAILKDKFPAAIQGIKNILKDIPFIGFETNGEISMKEGALSGFHNTTTVILLIPD